MEKKNLYKLAFFTGVAVIFITSIGYYGSSSLANIDKTRMAGAVVQSEQSDIPNEANAEIQFITTRTSSLYKDISAISTLYQKSSSVNDKARIDKAIVQKSVERKELMKQLMKSNSRLFNALAVTEEEFTSLPKAAQDNFEKEVTISGEITVIHIDDFDNHENSRFEYYIDTPKTRYSFYPTSETLLLSGTTIEVTGYALDKQFSADTDKNPVIIKRRPSPATPPSVGNQRTLVLLLKANPEDSEPFTPTQGHDLVFNGQFQNFMKEQSYDKVSFSGDVYGWYSLGHSLNCYGGSYGVFPSDIELNDIVNLYRINLTNYDRLVYLVKGAGGGCSGVGKGQLTVNGRKYLVSQAHIGLINYNHPSDWGAQPFSWTNLDFVLSHELGHSLGVIHANGWVCSDGEILYGDCQHLEYGNFFDTMGTVGNSLDYNAYFKEQLGWIPEQQVLSINKSGLYTINPLELKNGIKLAKVHIINTGGEKSGGIISNQANPYAIEFRKAIGFDSNLNKPALIQNQQGIFVNFIQGGTDGWAPATELLDMSPVGELGWWESIEKATLNLPSASSSLSYFEDLGRGIIIGPVTNVSSSSISFNVDLRTPSCERFVPKVTENHYFSAVAVGASDNINLKIFNPDYYGCGSSNFYIVPIVPPSWQYRIYPISGRIIAPSTSGYISLNFEVSGNALPGIYNISIDIVNGASGLKKTVIVPVQVSEPVRITNINPVYGPAGIAVTITGTGFDSVGKSNYVNISGTNSWGNSQNLSSAGGIIVYDIPTTITACADLNCKNTHVIPTPDGDYRIYVGANGASDTVDFHVGTPPRPPIVSIIATSTLATTYDVYGEEIVLTSKFKVSINSGSDEQKVAKINAFYSNLKTDNGFWGIRTSMHYAKPLGVSDDGNGFYVIPANTTAIFEVEATFNPKQMFAGAYYGVMNGVLLGDYINGKFINIPLPNTTNTIVIVGEKSPYINSVNPNPVASNQTLTISGVRFAQAGNVINFTNVNGGPKLTKVVPSSNSGQTIEFVPDIPEGNYILSITHPTTGDSNNIWFKVLPPVLKKSLSLDAFSGAYSIGSTVPIKWQSNDIKKVVIDLYDSMGLNKVRNITAVNAILGAYTGTYNWMIPSDVNFSTLYSVRVSDADEPTIYKNSSSFKITPPVQSSGGGGGGTPPVQQEHVSPATDAPTDMSMLFPLKWLLSAVGVLLGNGE